MGEIPNPRKNMLSGPNKGNYQIWVISALLVAIMGFTYFSKSNSAITISEKRFEEMMLSNDVAKVILIKNKDLVEVTLQEEALQNSKYKLELEGNRLANGPHYKFKIVDAKIFNDNFNRIQDKMSRENQINYVPEERQDFDDILINYGFIFLLIFGFWFMMRRMSGGGGPGGQIFNIGKSKAALFDAENKVKITFKVQQGLGEVKKRIKELSDFFNILKSSPA